MAKKNEENIQQPTNRQRLNERYKGHNPELNVDDDEALGAAILDDLDKYDQGRERMDRFNKTVQDSDIAPEMMAGILSGKNPDGSDFNLEEYILDNHIDYLLDYIDDNATAKEKMDRRREERDARRKADEEFEAGRQQRIEAEDAELDAAVAEMGYKPEQVKDLVDWIYDKDDGLIVRAARYELTKDDFLRLFRIKDYDVRLAEAENRGFKRGKNEKIDMYKRDQDRRGEMPADLGGGAKPADEPSQAKDPYISQLERMKNF